jgi:hypothetical protein
MYMRHYIDRLLIKMNNEDIKTLKKYESDYEEKIHEQKVTWANENQTRY